MVSAGSGVNLAAHVNHQVRVTGTVAGGPARSDDNSGSARPGGTTPSTGMTGDKGWETLTATSVSMVSATCTATN
jgi:hypothetical protein